MIDHQKFWNKLNSNQQQALDLYKSSGDFDDSFFFAYDLNNRLRNWTPLNDKWRSQVRHLDSVFEYCQFAQSTKLYRATFLEDLSMPGDPGKPLIQHSYMSCSLSLEGTQRHFPGHPGSTPVLLEIDCPEGTQFAPMEGNQSFGGHEQEVLLPRGSAFLIRDQIEHFPTDQLFKDTLGIFAKNYQKLIWMKVEPLPAIGLFRNIIQAGMSIALDRRVYRQCLKTLIEGELALERIHRGFADVPLSAIVSFNHMNWVRGNGGQEGVTVREAALNLDGQGQSGRPWDYRVFPYLSMEIPIRNSVFPAPDAKRALDITSVGGAVHCNGGNHRLVAMLGWLAATIGEHAVLSQVPVTHLPLPADIANVLITARREGHRVFIGAGDIAPARIKYRLCMLGESSITQYIRTEQGLEALPERTLNRSDHLLSIFTKSERAQPPDGFSEIPPEALDAIMSSSWTNKLLNKQEFDENDLLGRPYYP